MQFSSKSGKAGGWQAGQKWRRLHEKAKRFPVSRFATYIRKPVDHERRDRQGEKHFNICVDFFSSSLL
jgi:hypothetical protein|tara:strand:+ start:76199 stop:76402 length:204 start_codon:yes stop_codon:yes gene_type:complete